MRLIPWTIYFTFCWAIPLGAHISPTRSELIPQASPQAGITAIFTTDGLTLNLIAHCEPETRLCSFRAEIHAPQPLFDLISQVEYSSSSEPRSGRSPVMDAATWFRFEGKRIAGETVRANITVKRRGGASTEVVSLEGTIPFSTDVKPPLPDGLRFEDQYQRWYLEGGAGNFQLFKIRLRGEAIALNRIRSVEYRLPQSNFSRSTVLGKASDEYMLEDTLSSGARFEIVAVLRWRSGARSTHVISVRVP